MHATGIFPKIACFSALQRAENSSIRSTNRITCAPPTCFSALQRAENSSIREPDTLHLRGKMFQCSSASRKFLNATWTSAAHLLRRSFSALQRAENSSIGAGRRSESLRSDVSVLFSEPKIPQFRDFQSAYPVLSRVSVLFSEPKIPQSQSLWRRQS